MISLVLPLGGDTFCLMLFFLKGRGRRRKGICLKMGWSANLNILSAMKYKQYPVLMVVGESSTPGWTCSGDEKRLSRINKENLKT